ncbi:MAG: GNAT family N-acetyltransferase [Clostridiales bacterium]|nr:GNAT family N-acetyltransferase [Clostridiales bacterium]
MVEVREVATKKERKIFASFNADMYKDVPQAIPDLVSDEYNNFLPSKNPAYEYCRVKQFLAYKDGQCVGRIAGIINDAANTKWETKRIRFSRVDFINDYEVSKALFNAVEEWARSEGLKQIHGPIGFCDMDQEGMLIEGFDEVGMFITIYNHPYYISHLEKLGFKKDIDWVEYLIKMPEEANERMNKLSKQVMRKFNLKLIEPKTRKDLRPYISKVFRLLNIAYENLYGTVELTEKQIKKYYDQFILLVNTDYVKLIEDEDGELVGFGLAIPSMNDAVKKSNGRLFPFGWYRILRATKKPSKVLDLYLVGVLPKMQNRGLTAILLYSMTEVARENKVQYAETGPELETNNQVQALWKHYETKQHKRRRCWIKDL